MKNCNPNKASTKSELLALLKEADQALGETLAYMPFDGELARRIDSISTKIDQVIAEAKEPK